MLFTYKCWESPKSIDAELWYHTDQECKLLYRLPSDKVDEIEVGKMFRVRFEDGFEYDVFEDELSKGKIT
jgi:hypothetical protein